MISENVDCEFKGFDPSYEIKGIIARLADKLYYSAPSDSGIKLAIQKRHGIVRASCRIASQVGPFTAEAKGENPLSTIEILEKKIKHQLDSWKMNRFKKA